MIHNDIIRNTYRIFAGYEVKTEGKTLIAYTCVTVTRRCVYACFRFSDAGA